MKDALLALAEEMKNDPNYRPAPKGGKGATDGAKVPHAQFLHTYLSFIKVKMKVVMNVTSLLGIFWHQFQELFCLFCLFTG